LSRAGVGGQIVGRVCALKIIVRKIHRVRDVGRIPPERFDLTISVLDIGENFDIFRITGPTFG
jgi:hypothetical protein